MCGIFGYVSRQGEGPDIARLRRIALITQTRGDHAFGLAWLDEEGVIHTFRKPGPARMYLDELERCRSAVVMIGHCRYATHGSPADNRNNHPHVAGGGVFVHNGVVHNYDQILYRHSFDPTSQCDSEVLGLLMARGGGSLAQRSAWAANQVSGELAILGLWAGPARLLVARRGRPLHFGTGSDGYYFASLPPGLPGQVKPVADYTTRVLVHENGRLRGDGAPLRLAGGRQQ